MERQELQKAYNQYIEELALNALAHKPINQNLVNIITKIQSDMRDMDIVEAMKRIKENTTSNLNQEDISVNSTNLSESLEDFNTAKKR